MGLRKNNFFRIPLAILMIGLFSCSLFAEEGTQTAIGKLLKSIDLSVGFNTGWAFMRFDDFKEANEAFEESFANNTEFNATTRGFSGSFLGTLYLLAEWNVFKTHKLGFSIGYKTLPGGTFEQSLASQTFNMTNTYRVITSAIPFEFSYKVPMKVKGIPFRIKIMAGLDIWRSVIKYNSLLQFSGIVGAKTGRSLGYDYDEKLTQDGNLKGSGVGGHLASEVECDICDVVSFFFGCGCWCGDIDDYEGPVNNYDGETIPKYLSKLESGEIFALPQVESNPDALRGDFYFYGIFAGLRLAVGKNNHAYAEKKKKSKPERKKKKRL